VQKVLVVLSFLFLLCLQVAAQTQQTIRINAGSSYSYKDTKGQLWSADKGFNTGRVSISAPTSTVSGTSDPTLFKSARVGVATTPELQYQFALVNGLYKVNLYFAETYFKSVGSRVFDVQMQGATVFGGLDILALAGANHALVKTAQVSVTQGQIVIRLVHRVNKNVPIITAIEILPSGTATAPSVTANPTSLNFGSMQDGSSSTLGVTLTNKGTSNVTIASVAPAGTGFSASGLNAGTILTPNQTATLNVKFAPTSTGSVSGNVSISSNAQGSPLTIPLSGTGTQAQLTATPASVSFGNVVMGKTNSQTITLKNNGTAGVTISQANKSGTGFSLSGLAVPTTIAAGASTTFNVAFAPTSTASVSGSVSLVNNGPSSPLAIPLSGAGAAATYLLGASPTSLSFGNVTVNNSTSLNVALTNNGNSNVTIASVTPTGTGFSASGVNAGTTLSPNQTATLSVKFAPTTTGSANGTVSVSSNATNSPAAVSLSGTGVVQSGLDLTPPNCGITSTSNIVPNAAAWTNFVPPAVGGTYNDGGGYCTVKRITNIGSGGQMIPFYSLVQTISAGDTKLLLYNGDAAHWNIYDFNGKVVVSGSTFDSVSNDNATQPRWDRFDDSAIWVTTGNSIEKCTITMGTPGSMSCAITHTFTEYAHSVVFPGDTDMNENGWVPMVGQNVAGSDINIFMFQPNTNTKAGAYHVPGCSGEGDSSQPGCIHRLESTPNNGMTIEGIGSGQDLWLPPFSGAPTVWNPTSDHHATGYMTDGTTLAGAFEDFDHNTTGTICNYEPSVVFFSDTSAPYGKNCPMVPIGAANPGWHVSYMDHATRPWVTWTIQNPSGGPMDFNNEGGYAAPSSSNWKTYMNEIVMTRIDSNISTTPIVYRLALAHARSHAATGVGTAYWSDIYASTSWDGKYVVFNSNAAFNPKGCPADGYTGDCGDTYLIGPLF
jgi:Malectin domain/Abnormal spindle-like microcephaly-assoc'd, ASPM-SPD-2-Hydin